MSMLLNGRQRPNLMKSRGHMTRLTYPIEVVWDNSMVRACTCRRDSTSMQPVVKGNKAVIEWSQAKVFDTEPNTNTFLYASDVDGNVFL